MDIDPNKTYSKYEIITLGVLGKTEATVRKKIMEDAAGANILAVEIKGTGTMKRYFIKGDRIINYLNKL